jgi:hypothetical protein
MCLYLLVLEMESLLHPESGIRASLPLRARKT